MTVSLVYSDLALSATIPAPTVSDGDIMLVSFVNDGGVVNASLAGWTSVQDLEHGSASLGYQTLFKEASSESGDYAFTANTQITTIHIYRDSVGGGTWSIPDDSTNEESSATANTTAVAVATDDMLYTAWTNDGDRTVDTAPSGMTAGEGQSAGGSRAMFIYFEAISSPDATDTRQLVWNLTEQTVSGAIVLRYTVAGGGVTVNLTGQSIALSQGSLTVTGEAALTLAGQAVTSAQGTISVLLPQTVNLAGQSTTLSQGSLVVTGEALVSLSGQQVTATQGVLSVDIGGAVTVNLTGQQIALSQGTLTPTGEALVNLNGQSITSAQGVLTVSIITTPTIVNLTGQEITASDGILGLITANVISLTGQAITLTQGSLTVTGDQPNVPEAKGINSSGVFGVGLSVTATFSTGVGSKGNL